MELERQIFRAQELYEIRGGCPGLPVANSLCIRSLWTQSNVEPELNANFTEGADNVRLKGTICRQIQSSEAVVEVEVVLLGSPSLISLMVYVNVKQH